MENMDLCPEGRLGTQEKFCTPEEASLFSQLLSCQLLVRNTFCGGFPGHPLVKNPPSNAGDIDLIPGRETKIPHSTITTKTQKSQKKKNFFFWFKREGIYVYLWLIHVEVWQKTTKFCKTIILQLKNKLILKNTFCIMFLCDCLCVCGHRNTYVKIHWNNTYLHCARYFYFLFTLLFFQMHVMSL